MLRSQNLDIQKITPRKAARALIIEYGRVLVCHNRDRWGDWYLVPGGGCRPDESLEEAAVRECREELGIEARMLGLLCTHEISWAAGTHPRFAQEIPVHQVESIFLAERAENVGGPTGRQFINPIHRVSFNSTGISSRCVHNRAMIPSWFRLPLLKLRQVFRVRVSDQGSGEGYGFRFEQNPAQGEPTKMDSRQVGVTWLPLQDLESVSFFPRALVPYLVRHALDEVPEYLLDEM